MCRECCCGPPLHMHSHPHLHKRRFLTKEERAKKLESYAEELRQELTAVEERIKELRSQ